MAHEIARIVRREIAALVGEGVPYIQLDAPYYTSYLDAKVRERLRQHGVDPDRAFEESLAADRASLDGGGRALRSDCTSAAATRAADGSQRAGTTPSPSSSSGPSRSIAFCLNMIPR